MSLEQGRSGSIFGRSDASRLDFGGRNPSIFEVCRRSNALDANFVRRQQNTVKTGTRGTSEISRDKTKPTKNRSEGAFDCARCNTSAHTAHSKGLGASWGGSGKLLDGSWPLLARSGRPKIGLGAAFGPPAPVPSASGRLPEAALGARNGPRSICRRFLVDLRRFSSMFDRFFVDESLDRTGRSAL